MLKVGTILHGTYRIDSYLSSGGFGNTYVATNVEFEERVAIKEFFMKGVTQRDDNQTTVSVSNTENHNSFLAQKEKFKKEARRIRQLKNEHIVSVHDLFEENGTAYYVMDYVDGENLAERLKRTGKPMTESEVREILPQILDALKSIHDAGIWHLDLKPANIMLEKGGNVKLIDFGASKQLNAQKGGATTSTAISYTNGYAPREQMEQNYDKFGPWTDIYTLGATLYNLLTNERPPLPTDIDDDISEDKHEALPFPEGVEDLKYLVLQMMKTNRLQRPQSITVIMEAEKARKDEPKQAPRQQPTLKSVSDYDEEVTIIAQPQINEQSRNNSNMKDYLGEQSESYSFEGGTNNAIMVCPECKGTGIKKEYINDGFLGRMEYEVPCPGCNGVGHIKYKNDRLKKEKSTINSVKQPFGKTLITCFSLLITLCIAIIFSSDLFFVFGEYSYLYESYVIGNLSLSDFAIVINSAYIIFILLSVIILLPLIIGVWHIDKRLSYILIIVILLIPSKFIYHLIVVEETIIPWILSYCLLLLYGVWGITIIFRYNGRIKKLGYFVVIYTVCCTLLNILVWQVKMGIDSPLNDLIAWSADLMKTWSIWWFLTRNGVGTIG